MRDSGSNERFESVGADRCMRVMRSWTGNPCEPPMADGAIRWRSRSPQAVSGRVGVGHLRTEYPYAPLRTVLAPFNAYGSPYAVCCLSPHMWNGPFSKTLLL